jgi:PEP-CTERM motif
MKRSVIAALGAAVIAMLTAGSAAEAAVVDFGVTAVDGSINYTGASLDQSTMLDLDLAILVTTETAVDDASGLTIFDPVSLVAMTFPPSTQIIYASGLGPLGADITLTWVATVGPDAGSVFTETLTTVTSINRATTDQIGLKLTGTLTSSDGSFLNAPVLLSLTASQANTAIQVGFTNTSSVTPSIPEPSTWMMMGLGFGALGYAGFRRRKGSLLPA